MELNEVVSELVKDSFIKMIISNPEKKSNPYRRIVLTVKQIKGKDMERKSNSLSGHQRGAATG